MSETAAPPDVLTPGPEDKQTRKAAPGPVSDPEAPFGWMKDPKTGETRPRKRPGNQGKRNKVDPPPRRAATKARAKAAPPATAQDFSGAIGELAQGVWMVMASVPSMDVKIGKVSVADISTRFKAQASILKDNGDGVIKSVNMMAQHNPAVRKGVETLTKETGPAWILPAMMVALPFVGQSLAMWRAPIAGDVTLLAKRTEADFDALMHSSMHQAAAEQAAAERLAAEDAARNAA